jgi:pimeloyl-ACP methyl ester carboxylesterase
MTTPLPPLVLLPGTLCTKATFAHQTQHLQDCAKVQVVPLFQGSTIGDSASWVLEHTPQEPFALVGFSQGAIVALEIMRQAPERVQKLCLISANPKEPTAQQLETWKTWQREVEQGNFETIIQSFTRNVHPDQPATLRETILEMARQTGSQTFITQLQALASRVDSRPFLFDIRCPILLIVGRQDKVTPLEFHLEIKEHIPHAALIPLEECGHYAPLEQPQAVTALLRFWLTESAFSVGS